MRAPASSTLLAAAGLALCCLAAAGPAPAPTPAPTAALARRNDLTIRPSASFMTVDPTAPWVSVNDEGQPVKTVTPSVATVSGTPSVVDGAPHDLTASVYSWTSYGLITTSTGAPPNPTATKASTPEGAFSRCFNQKDDFAPFCRPLYNSTLLTSNTFYITWDPDFYNHTRDNTTYEVAVRLDYLNKTSNQMIKLDTYERVPAHWGYWPFKLTPDHLMGQASNNVTITLLVSPHGSGEKNQSVALPVVLARPTLGPPTPSLPPNRSAILIALPVSLGAFLLILVGLCLWHRQTRRIKLGNVMGRARHGYSGRAHRRLFRSAHGADKDRGIQLDTAPLSPPPADYRDDVDRPRRDSDALGSLAGSPVKDTFDAQGPGAGDGKNAFRDEMRRQARERRGGY
ncbi:hypothetical protein HRG_010934 [Hirsutella rhossiliensis]|uniref:Mid2 domain-containing protein n=1 Tax=Hirsutella rhossiliensis TaxID=111463 RepID=A0A9P8SCR4_9HYPO|nr:uncharacterized protein HRG_10934 [Hirsutella rhossiliensis]KAH0957841.1 hypothetical protein HRG_10934 [Hirsutella rhossiliensis]